MKNILQGNFMIFNAYKILPDFQQYPWKEMQGKIPLTEEVLMNVGKKYGLRRKWLGNIPLYGISAEHLEMLQKYIHTELFDHVAELTYVNHLGRMEEEKSDFGKNKWIRHSIAKVVNNSPFLGIPSQKTTFRLRWRIKHLISNSEHQTSGAIFLNIIIPLDKESVVDAVQIIETYFLKYAYEPMISINVLSERTACIIADLIYDRDELGGDKQAMRCYFDTMNKLIRRGYYPYRIPIFAMDWLKNKNSEMHNLLEEFKSIVDPNTILSPGRYV